MRNWPSQLFPIVLLSLLAGLSFILKSAVDRVELSTADKVRHIPDAMAENFSILRLDENGQIKYRLIAPYMEHYPDDDSALVNAPTFVAYRPDAAPVIISGGHGKSTSGGDVVFLWEDVIVHREHSNARPAMLARTPDLTVQSETGFAFTSSPVHISQANAWLKGVGMELDNNQSTFVLRSQVTGLYYRPGTAP
jgi:lipopolysaccharide export system protein LptC